MNKEEILDLMRENNIDIDYTNTENKTFEELGLDSVDLMMLIFAIKSKYKVDLTPDKKITLEETVDRINEYLKK